MGSYHSGGTIVKNGKFSTFDPAEDLNAVSPSSKTKTKTPSSKPERATSGGAKRRIFKKTDRRKLIRRILDCAALQKSFDLPDYLPPYLMREINAETSAEVWARKQPIGMTYAKKREARSAARKNEVSSPPVILEKSISPKVLRPSSSFSVEKMSSFAKKEHFQKCKTEFLRAVVGRILINSKKKCSQKSLPPALVEDILKFKSQADWARAQPDFAALYERLSRSGSDLQPNKQADAAPKVHPETTRQAIEPRLDSAPRPERALTLESSNSSLEAIMKRGLSRAKISAHELSDVDFAKLVLGLGLLPSSPVVLVKGKTQKARTKIHRSWRSSLTNAQKEAWNLLSEPQKNQYLISGKVSIG